MTAAAHPPEIPTRDRLVTAAATLFRQKGYHATGLAEILAAAGVPKGSLYHHFPEGKADLARAAADWTAAMLIRVIDDSFATASTYANGATTFCFKTAKLFDLTEAAQTCPISALMFDGPESEPFRQHADATFRRLISRIADHGARLGLAPDDALRQAEALVIAIEGGWTLARARRDSGVIRRLPAVLFG